MKPELRKMLFSIMGGTATTIIFITTSYILDKFMSSKFSTAIALILGAICNFFMQQKAFLNTANFNVARVGKYLVSNILILIACQIGVNYLINKKKQIQSELENHVKSIKKYEKYYNTFVRLFVRGIVFIFIAFPIRRYWVFNNK